MQTRSSISRLLIELLVAAAVVECFLLLLLPTLVPAAWMTAGWVLNVALLLVIVTPFIPWRAARVARRARAQNGGRHGVRDLLVALGCVGLGVGLICSVANTAWAMREDALANYRLQENRKTMEVRARTSDLFRGIYQRLRTIARLPGVKTIDRHAHDFDEDAKTTVQEIYNNLAEIAPVSELYIVPVDLEPDALDPETGKNQEPITTFDKLIVGKTAASSEDGHGEEGEDEVEEIEIFEYRLMKQQLAVFKERFPYLSDVDGLDFPAVCGPQVITCDNTRFDPRHPDDQKRSGIVYSVPFYGPDDKLKGCVTAVLLTCRLQETVGDPDRALVRLETGYVVGGNRPAPAEPTSVERSRAAMLGQPCTDLLYSESFAADIPDVGSQWKVWSAVDDSRFLDSAAVAAIVRNERIGFAGTAVVTMLLAAAAWSMIGARIRAEAIAEGMTADLNSAKNSAEAANRAKSQFLANMSHEIRTPLTAILGYADLLKEDQALPSQELRTATVETIRSAGAHLLAIINDILDLSKIEADKMTVESIDTPLLAIVREVDSLMRPRAVGKGVALTTRLEAPTPDRVLGDPTRLRQVLMNLVGNAVKFTEEGSVTVSVTVAHAPGGDRLVIDVRDTGSGMTPEQQSRLFQPFGQADATMTRRFGGTGLGLTISRRLAGLMGGSVDLTETAPGKGSCFRLELPLAPAPGAVLVHDLQAIRELTPPSVAKPIPRLSGRILLVEDGVDNQRLIALHLRRAGALVAVCDNGAIALRMIDAAVAAGEPYDLLLTDMQMPEMDGYTLARTLRQRGSRLAVVALTAHAMAEDRERCLSAGCDDYTSKPIDKAALIGTCADWIGRSSNKTEATRRAA